LLNDASPLRKNLNKKIMELKRLLSQINPYTFRHREIEFMSVTSILAGFLLMSCLNVQATDVFVKGINLNGNAVTIDENSWISYSSALSNGFSTTSVSTYSNSITWSPATDAGTNYMLNSVIYKSSGSFTMRQIIADGTYKVYFWLTENYSNYARSEDIKLEGKTVATEVGLMQKNTWVKVGPYTVTVSDGALDMDFVKNSGDPQCSGLAIYSTDSSPTISSVIDGWSQIEAENYTISAPKAIQKNSVMLSGFANNQWVQYDSLDLHTATNYFQINVANGSESSSIQILIDGVNEETFNVDNTGSWNNFQIKTYKLKTQQSGVKNVKLIFGKSSLKIDWFMFSSWSSNLPETLTLSKPRVINTTDLGADPDDQMSLVRVMVTSNEYDLEGLIVVTSLWKTTQSSTAMLDTILNAYGKVVSNLQNHASGYPSLAYLESISKLGQSGFGMADVGADKDSPGSELIISAVDKDDPRPVWINLWGGGNTLAQALWKVKNTRTPDQVDHFVSKLRVYDVLGQDDAGAWMTKTFPELFYIRFMGVYDWQPSDSWIKTNVQSKGPLGAVYPNRIWAAEGDSPAFLYQYPNGLGIPEHVDWGNWGGRMDLTKKVRSRGMTGGEPYNEAQYDPYYVYSDAPEGGNSISRWSTAINNDLSARMDWSITNAYSGANHHPVATLNNDTTKAVLYINASAGSNISLDASGSSDPDGNNLVYSWKFYIEPSTYKGIVTIQNNISATPTISIPSDALGKTIHVIMELHDNGSPNLYAYRRVIINVE
jgi:hypothetical protein